MLRKMADIFLDSTDIRKYLKSLLNLSLLWSIFIIFNFTQKESRTKIILQQL